MALPDRYSIEKKLNSMEGLSAYENGGKGSGNWGHAGRPGEVGGSAPSGSTSASWRDLPDDAETLEFDSIEKVYLEDRGGWPAYKKKLYDKYSTRYPDKKIVVRRTRMQTKGLLEYAVFGLKKDGEQKGKGKSGGQNVSLKGKSLYEKVHMIEPGDEVHIKPSSKVPNFPKEIKVDYVEDGTIHYGSSETSDGYTYPAWAIDDIKKIIRKK